MQIRRSLVALVLCITATSVAVRAEMRRFENGQRVSIRGTVRAFDGVTAKDGTRYVIFMLDRMTVIAKGRPDLYEEDSVVIRGTFRAVSSAEFPTSSWRGAFGPIKHHFDNVIEADPGSL